MSMSHHGQSFSKLIKIIINIIVLVLYRNGDEGYFMGASFNKDPDAEILTAGVFIGFLIYNLISLAASILDNRSVNQSVTETIMNFVGAILWLVTGGVIMQWWIRFIPGNHFAQSNPSAPGIVMGVLAVINSAVYFGETFLTYNTYKNME